MKESFPVRSGFDGHSSGTVYALRSPLAVKELAVSLPTAAWKAVTWRQGVKRKLRSRFAAVRVRPAHRDY